MRAVSDVRILESFSKFSTHSLAPSRKMRSLSVSCFRQVEFFREDRRYLARGVILQREALGFENMRERALICNDFTGQNVDRQTRKTRLLGIEHPIAGDGGALHYGPTLMVF